MNPYAMRWTAKPMAVRFHFCNSLPLLVLVVLGCGELTEPVEALRLESEHFVFSSTTEWATMAELGLGVEIAEGHFGSIENIVGAANAPTEKITVRLEGDLQDRGPYFDFSGVHMYRYPDSEGGYWALLAHELVHAFREDYVVRVEAWNWLSFGFFEEGFAEFVAQLIEPDKRGFPFYGFPEDVVAGQWLVRGEYIPPATLRERHAELNQPCEIQAYPERASWFRFMDEVYGRQAVLDLAYPDSEPNTEVVQALLGVGLEQLDQQWDEWLTARYQAYPNADQVAQQFRQRTSGHRVCRSGVDF
jgi:hypothetical protein